MDDQEQDLSVDENAENGFEHGRDAVVSEITQK